MAPDGDVDGGLPLFTGKRTIDGKPTAYLCQNYVCELPVTNVDALAAQLDGDN
jgi:uncharacterized protein YyaL (SSP411 family)